MPYQLIYVYFLHRLSFIYGNIYCCCIGFLWYLRFYVLRVCVYTNLVKHFRYIFLFVVTLVVIIVWPTNGLNIHLHIGEYMSNIFGIFKSNTKEKDEDENCEYEMVWDAEGSMHLIKKPLKTVPSHSTERVER